MENGSGRALWFGMPTAVEGAAVFLGRHLTACGGSAERSDVVAAGAAAGYHDRLLARAMARAGVRSLSVPGAFPRRTVWVLGVTEP